MNSNTQHDPKEDGLLEYDFSKGKRGPVIPARPAEAGKTKVTIRLDDDIIDYYMAEADKTGGKAGYQTLINQALRQQISAQSPTLLEAFRQVIREEIGQLTTR